MNENPMKYMEPLTLRMLGENVQLRRWQWEELRDSLRESSSLCERITELLGDEGSYLSESAATKK